MVNAVHINVPYSVVFDDYATEMKLKKEGEEKAIK
jgi:hypothetical protein